MYSIIYIIEVYIYKTKTLYFINYLSILSVELICKAMESYGLRYVLKLS